MSTKVKTVIKPLRIGGAGLAGTIARSKHHAEILLPYISAMRGAVKHLGFVEWKQGETIHEFKTVDGTRYTLRAFHRDGKYAGVRLALREHKSKEHRLLDIDKVEDTPLLLSMMACLARPMLGERGDLQCN